jgi:hypothetical protein
MKRKLYPILVFSIILCGCTPIQSSIEKEGIKLAGEVKESSIQVAQEIHRFRKRWKTCQVLLEDQSLYEIQHSRVIAGFYSEEFDFFFLVGKVRFDISGYRIEKRVTCHLTKNDLERYYVHSMSWIRLIPNNSPWYD